MWYMMRPQILPHPFTCTLICGTPFEPRLEGNTSWSTLILIKICGNKTGCKMKTNGYLIFNYRNLDVYEPQCSGFWHFVITHFNATVFLTHMADNLTSPNVLLLYRPLLVQSRNVFHSVSLMVVMFCNSGVQVRTATVASVNTVLYTTQTVKGFAFCV